MHHHYPLVSIIVAIYNIKTYLPQCIESIINQDYANLEVILVDDCSTDGSKQICDAYAEQDSRISVIHHTINQRHSKTRNDGLDEATGDFIVFVDGDDWLASDFISYMLHVITVTQADIAINLVNYTTRDTSQVPDAPIQMWTAEKTLTELLYPHLPVGVWNKIYRRDFIENNHLRFLDRYTAEGELFINTAVQYANRIGVGCHKAYYYRLNNAQSATTQYDVKQGTESTRVLREINNNLTIRTRSVLAAVNQHIWLNEFWTIRQIFGTRTQNKNAELLHNCKAYVRRHFWPVVVDEKRFSKRIKYFATGLFPIVMAKLKNLQFDISLHRDQLKHNIERKY
ncbi:glycosyltransferase family 2 protein [Bifidobacterium sp. 6T3]|uniref:Glycosyltransferase family 2 protein n=2 Tax=Bifidobacterium phasiani TaxID=2834431 RepID=A0ABS6WA47_9BIFI|nr:glycosyltransferase family 2 protein [Bifidobacterium phasiani]MBW3082607.1 glycosyltransferase family 2 protein [Bifidobacterium phasiani]